MDVENRQSNRVPVFCIAAPRIIDRATQVKHLLPYAAIAGLGIFGLLSTTSLIIADVTSAQFDATAFVAGHNDNETTIVSSPDYSWILIYVFDKGHVFTDYRDLLFYPVETEKILLISDQHFQYDIGASKRLRDAYDNTKPVATFSGNVYSYDLGRYPYTSMAANYEGSKVEVRISNWPSEGF